MSNSDGHGEAVYRCRFCTEEVATSDGEPSDPCPTCGKRGWYVLVTDGGRETAATSQGLYGKYEVRKNDEPVEDCFVLEPETDTAARHALAEYADVTDNPELADDLREWVASIEMRYLRGESDG